MKADNPYDQWNLVGPALPDYTDTDAAPELGPYHPDGDGFRVMTVVVPYSRSATANHVRMLASQDWPAQIQVIINDLRFRPYDGVDWDQLNARAAPGIVIEDHELWDWTLTIETIDGIDRVVDRILWIAPDRTGLVQTAWHWEHQPSFL